MADDATPDGTFFPYRFDRRYRFIWRPLGARPGVDGVRLTESSFVATYGRWRLETPITNVTRAHVTRGYKWWKAIGIRLSFVDDGLTFGTSTHGGVCVHFDRPAHRVIGRKDHSALTATVENLDGLVAAIVARVED